MYVEQDTIKGAIL